MIPEDVKKAISSDKEEMERLEVEQSRIALSIMKLVDPYTATVEGCNELLDLLPLGYCTFKVRQALSALEEKAREDKAVKYSVHRCPMCGKYVIYAANNFHPYCGCGYDQLSWNDGLTKVTRDEAERFAKHNE